MQKLILQQTKTSQQTTSTLNLTFNIPDIDELLPTLKEGDFTILYGSQTVTSLLSQLCIRAHLQTEQGGLNSKTVFIDAAKSSTLPNILQTAELQQLEPQEIREQIQHYRAYTAYRLHSLIIEQLEQIIKTTDIKLVAISDIMYQFLTENIDDSEARMAYTQIMNHLSNFAKKHNIIIVATNLPHEDNPRNSTLQDITNAKANVILRHTKTPYTSEIELEKHPSNMLGVMDFNCENKTLLNFCL
ncbi:MAG: hypothetical protein FWF66_06630 [Candidatus Bathyarchaeota archaeon]|nr:hypothetical protein [Candidatus Termiticorpusculum sp.]MCL1971110.1 hypothetical protein [Candidatus Termiticorpusculum sp.]